MKRTNYAFALLTLAFAHPSQVSANLDVANQMDSLATLSAGTLNSDSDEELPGSLTFKANTDKSQSKVLRTMNPSIKFGGYIMGKYSITDCKNQASNGGFDLRFLRLYADGNVFQDFYYKFQLEVNAAPGEDKGPRVLDAFVEWKKYNFLRLKLGQFKRPFGFENPMSPLLVGLGSYSQATSKLASLGDRNGEHKSSGRDLGFQIQGDLLPASDGHNWIHYQVGFFNGQGINHADKDNFKDLIAGLWISPVKGLAIGGFGWNGRYVNEKYDANNENNLKRVKRVRWGAGLKYDGDITLRGEYMYSLGQVITSNTSPNHADAWYATIGVPATKDLKFFARYDCYRANHSWNSLCTNYGISGNYWLGKNLLFQLNYTYTDDRNARMTNSNGDSHYNTFDVQVTARF